MANSVVDKEQWMEGIRSLNRDSALTALGIEIVDAGDAFCVLSMPISDLTRMPMGMLHGGMSMMLAETAAGVHATWGTDLSERVPVGIEISGSHLNSASEGSVQAVVRLVNRSRSFIVHEVKVVHVETDRLLSVARVTHYYKSVGGS